MPGPKGRRDERQPLVTVDHYGIAKELFFGYKDIVEVKNAGYVNLTIRKDFWTLELLTIMAL
jgi:hypothetical protein